MSALCCVMLPIFVISLKAAESRRAAITRRMGDLGLEFSFIEAVRGTDIPMDQKEALVSHQRRRHLGAPFSDGALGCLVSHRRAWERLRDGNIAAALILEDDAVLTPEALDVLPRIAALEGRFDLVNLHHTSGRPLVDIARLSPTHALSITRYASIGAIGYVVSRDAAERLLAVSTPGIFEVDVMMNRWWEHGLKTLVLSPSVVREDGHDSTIGYPGVKPKWDQDRIGDRIARDLNRKRDSVTKRLAFPGMVRSARLRLAKDASRRTFIDTDNLDLTRLTEPN